MTPPAGTPLTGTWQPDARTADPDTVLDTSPRSAFLNSFNLLDARGAWTLFVADLSTGEEHTLNTWSLELTGAVPEPGSMTLLSIGIVLLAGSRRRERAPGAAPTIENPEPTLTLRSLAKARAASEAVRHQR